jgi:hypothetical protein
MVGIMTLTDIDNMTEQQEEYNSIQGKTIANRLNRLSLNKIKEIGKKWNEKFREP